MRILNECSTRLFKYSDRQLAADGGEVVQKNCQRIASFKVVKQDFDWHAGTGKDRCSAVDLGMDGDRHCLHDSVPTLIVGRSLMRECRSCGTSDSRRPISAASYRNS